MLPPAAAGGRTLAGSSTSCLLHSFLRVRMASSAADMMELIRSSTARTGRGLAVGPLRPNPPSPTAGGTLLFGPRAPTCRLQPVYQLHYLRHRACSRPSRGLILGNGRQRQWLPPAACPRHGYRWLVLKRVAMKSATSATFSNAQVAAPPERAVLQGAPPARYAGVQRGLDETCNGSSSRY